MAVTLPIAFPSSMFNVQLLAALPSLKYYLLTTSVFPPPFWRQSTLINSNIPHGAKLQIEEFLQYYERPVYDDPEPPMDFGPARIDRAALYAIFKAKSSWRSLVLAQQYERKLKSCAWAFNGQRAWSLCSPADILILWLVDKVALDLVLPVRIGGIKGLTAETPNDAAPACGDDSTM